jgi:hypothetical protein
MAAATGRVLTEASDGRNLVALDSGNVPDVGWGGSRGLVLGEVDAPPSQQESTELASSDEPQQVGMAAAAPARAQPFGEIENLICAYAWNCATAIRIARCESSLRPDAIGAGSFGLFQLSSIHQNRFPGFWDFWMNAEQNVAWAYQIWLEQNWYPWSCF